MAEAPSNAGGVLSALASLCADRGWEAAAPAPVNTLHRFNVWPEVGFALARRATCAMLPEGAAVCSGSAQDAAMTAIFWLQGLAAAALALAAMLAAGGPGGSLVCLAAVITYMGYATRVNTSPVLRENLAAPWLWLQVACLFSLLLAEAPRESGEPDTAADEAANEGPDAGLAPPAVEMSADPTSGGNASTLQKNQVQGSVKVPPNRAATATATAATDSSRLLVAAYMTTTILLLLTWQFGPFLLLLQTVALFGAYCVGAMSPGRLVIWLRRMQAAGLLAALFMFGNTMILFSLWLCVTVAIEVVLTHLPSDGTLGHNVIQGTIVAVGSLGMKHIIGRLLADDDGHVYKLLGFHLFGSEDFMSGMFLVAAVVNSCTLETVGCARLSLTHFPLQGLYLCGQVYQPMNLKGVGALSQHYLLPAALLAGMVAVVKAQLFPQGRYSALLATAAVQSMLFVCLGFGVRR